MPNKDQTSKSEKDLKKNLENSPSETLGCCTLRSAGYIEKIPNKTKAYCDSQAVSGITATWEEGDC